MGLVYEKKELMKRSNARFSVELVNDAYYHIELGKDIDFNVQDLKQVVIFEKELGSKHLPVLVSCPSSATTTVELMQYLSKNINNPHSKADVFVISSISQKIMANFYLKINKPERPTRFFTDRSQAMQWMQQYL